MRCCSGLSQGRQFHRQLRRVRSRCRSGGALHAGGWNRARSAAARRPSRPRVSTGRRPIDMPYQRDISAMSRRGLRRDYQLLTNEVATVLNDIAQSTDRPSALEAAERARRMLVEWPRAPLRLSSAGRAGNRAMLDSAIPDCKAVLRRRRSDCAGRRTRDVARAAGDNPGGREQVARLLRLATGTPM